MMRWIRMLLKLGLGIVALLAGCFNPTGQSMYGMPPAEKDPEVEIVDFSYAPAQGLRVGDEVVFKATLNKPLGYAAGGVFVQFPPSSNAPTPYTAFGLSDNGVLPDQVAGDGIFTFGVELTSPCDSLPVAAVYFDLERFATPLTVLPEEEEQQ